MRVISAVLTLSTVSAFQAFTTPSLTLKAQTLPSCWHMSATEDIASEISHQENIATSSSPSLDDYDPEIANLIVQEDHRQRLGLELIASENFASAAVRQVLGSCLTNKYSEGMVGKRYYGGNKYIDEIEKICQTRALSLYGLSPEEWGVNVQPYSGSPANFAVYTALLSPHQRIMGLDLPAGGHLTHGYQTASGKKVSATSVYFESLPYTVDRETGLIDYDDMEYRATLFQPKLLIAGGSAYPREWDYKRMREIADKVGAIFMTDMAHISGLVAGQSVDSPFKYSDIVTTTTHKTLRGPRSGMIFGKVNFMDQINTAVFPMLQGGPHNHQIGGVAVALKEASTVDFKAYSDMVIKNAQALARSLISNGHTLATGGTDNHLLLWDVRPLGLTGSKLEKVLEMVDITTNKNSLPGDVSAINPGGVRLGTPALTTRGLTQDDFEYSVGAFLHRASEIASEAQGIAQKRKGENQKVLLKEFLAVLKNDEEMQMKLEVLNKDVKEFAQGFSMPGAI